MSFEQKSARATILLYPSLFYIGWTDYYEWPTGVPRSKRVRRCWHMAQRDSVLTTLERGFRTQCRLPPIRRGIL